MPRGASVAVRTPLRNVGWVSWRCAFAARCPGRAPAYYLRPVPRQARACDPAARRRLLTGVSLPLPAGEAAGVFAESRAHREAHRSGGSAPMARVTVIDDSPDFLGLMREVITELGHQMTGMEAIGTNIEDVVRSRPDLLMVDLRLENTPQEVSGWEMIILAKSHHDLLKVPVILCTADVWEIKQRAKDLEQIAGVHVRTKPFDMDEMCHLIQTLLAGSKARPKRRFRADLQPQVAGPEV